MDKKRNKDYVMSGKRIHVELISPEAEREKEVAEIQATLKGARKAEMNQIICLRSFLAFALRILSAHNLWRHLARPRVRAY